MRYPSAPPRRSSLRKAFLQWVEEGTVGEPSRPERYRILMQHVVFTVLSVVGCVYVALFTVLGVWRAVTVLGLVLVLVLGALFGLTRRGRVTAGGRAMSALLFLDLVAAIEGRGGIEGHAAPWLLAVPLVAGLMVDMREARRFAFVVIAAYAGFWGAQHLGGVTFRSDVPDAVRHYMPMLDLPAMVLLQVAILWALDHMWRSWAAELTDRNAALREENAQRVKAEEAARASAEARYTFLATMSHEIRTPLNGILGITESLIGSGLNESQARLAHTVNRSGILLRTLLDDVLSFSRVESGQVEIEPQVTAIRGLIEEVHGLWDPTARAQGSTLTYVAEEGLPTHAMLDRQKVLQVLGNLVCNAIKFSPRGGDVSLHAAREGDVLRFDIRDQGQGIAPEAQSRIFEPFEQGDGTASRSFGGAGLGLAICRRLVDAMEGTIAVSSVEGAGSTFTVRLPLVPAPAPARHEAPMPETTALGSLRILAAEDDAVNRMVLELLLEKLEVEVVLAHDGMQAVSKWRSDAFDLILMDCQMPVCDGYEASRTIREAGGTLPIIAVTANAMPGDRQRCLDAGMDDHLGKPISLAALEAVLRRWTPWNPSDADAADGADAQNPTA